MTIDESFRSLARMQVIFASVGLVCAVVGQAIAPRALTPVAYTVSGAFLALVLYAGRELRRATRRGILLSLVVQAAQVLHLNFSTFGTLFLAGPFVELGASRSVILLHAGAGAVASLAPMRSSADLMPGAELGFHFGWLLDTAALHPSIAIGVNVVALVFVTRLWGAWHSLSVVASQGGD